MRTVTFTLTPATEDDRPWLEQLRRDVYQELFDATFGGWDEARHARQFDDFWKRGKIEIIRLDTVLVGMIQLFEERDALEVGEIQVQPSQQNRGIGTSVLMHVIARAQDLHKAVRLSVGLRNERAIRLYQGLGFQETSRTDTHVHMAISGGGESAA